MRQFYFFLGRPGAGKTTLSNALSNEITSYNALSAGDEARHLGETDEGIKTLLKAGRIAPPDMFDAHMLRRLLHGPGYPMIVDGYPRYWQQLMDILLFLDPNYRVGFFNIHCRASISDQRLVSRGRGDFDAERIKFFDEHTEPIIRYLENTQRIYTIDNNNTDRIDEVVQLMINHINLGRGYPRGQYISV